MTPYDRHQDFIAPARASAGVPRLIGSFVFLVFAVGAFNLALLEWLQGRSDWAQLQVELTDGSTARGVLITLASFVLPAGALWVSLRLIHKRGLRSLFGPLREAFHDFYKVLRVGLVMLGVFLIIPMPEALRPDFHMSFADWLPLVPLGVLALLIQVSTEELIFRGYLQSQLAARFMHPAVWMVLPSVLFGFLHLSPETYGDNAVIIALWAVGFGIVAADLTARVGNLGPAIALHFVNNVSALLIMAMSGHWDGLALLHVPYGPDDTDIVRTALLIEGPVLLCLWLAARIAIRR